MLSASPTDYVRILPGKSRAKKKYRISSARRIRRRFDGPAKMDIRIYGETAIAIIELRTRVQTPDGHTIDSRGRATKVFVGRDGKWFSRNLPVNR